MCSYLCVCSFFFVRGGVAAKLNKEIRTRDFSTHVFPSINICFASIEGTDRLCPGSLGRCEPCNVCNACYVHDVLDDCDVNDVRDDNDYR